MSIIFVYLYSYGLLDSLQKKGTQSKFLMMKERLHYKSCADEAEIQPPLSGVVPLIAVPPAKEDCSREEVETDNMTEKNDGEKKVKVLYNHHFYNFC